MADHRWLEVEGRKKRREKLNDLDRLLRLQITIAVAAQRRDTEQHCHRRAALAAAIAASIPVAQTVEIRRPILRFWPAVHHAPTECSAFPHVIAAGNFAIRLPTILPAM